MVTSSKRLPSNASWVRTNQNACIIQLIVKYQLIFQESSLLRGFTSPPPSSQFTIRFGERKLCHKYSFL